MKKSIEDNKNELIDEITETVEREDSPSEDSLGINFAKDGINKPSMKVESNQDSYDATHGKLYKMTHENTIPWRNYLIYGIILTMLSCCICFAKYITDFSGDNRVTVANFSYSINATDAANTSVKYIANTDEIKNGTFDLDSTLNKYEFAIKNTGQVTVDVFPTKSSTDKNGNAITSRFGIAFYKSKDNKTTLDKNDGKDCIRLTPGDETSIFLWIDSTSVANENVDERLILNFDIVQVD